jgi:hypothetical protein
LEQPRFIFTKKVIAQGIGGVRSSHGAQRRGRSGSGAPESPISGACAGNAPKLLEKSLKVKLL